MRAVCDQAERVRYAKRLRSAYGQQQGIGGRGDADLYKYFIARSFQLVRSTGIVALIIYAHPSKTLRPLNDEERHSLGELSIIRREVRNAWIAVEDEFAAADRSEIDPKTLADIGDDLSDQALEGFTAEQWTKIRRRAAWLADGFVRRRREAGTLSCDHCRLDPMSLIGQHKITPRSLLDVHHKHPISLGTRYSSMADFALLCPTCHRLEHRLLAVNASLFPAA